MTFYSVVSFMGYLAICMPMAEVDFDNNKTIGNGELFTRQYRVPSSAWDYRWSWTTITVKIEEYPPQLSKEQVDTAVKIALHQWAAVVPLRLVFIESGPANILLHFMPKGMPVPRDDNEGTVAITFVLEGMEPGIIKRMYVYFDGRSTWSVSTSINSRNTKSVYFVALHELGHALGLGHLPNEQAVMHEAYATGLDGRNSRTMNGLTDDDIKAIQELYPPPWIGAKILIKAGCDHLYMYLSCDPDHVLHIVSAEYGNYEFWPRSQKCDRDRLDQNCVYPTDYASKRCNNERYCTIFVCVENLMTHMKSDPCAGLNKTLRLRYVCHKPQK